MDKRDLVKGVSEYLQEMEDRQFASEFLPEASVLLSGSTGWGIPEGLDSRADWDIHIILKDSLYENYVLRYGPNHVLDDHGHKPAVFAQIQSESWLSDRFGGKDTAVLYLWLYENGTWVADNSGIASQVKDLRQVFEAHREELARDHFVAFSVRRFDASSSVKRNLFCSAGIYRGAMAEAALRAFCIAKGSPYPYAKWLPKQVQMLGGSSLVELCEKCLAETDTRHMPPLFKQLRMEMEDIMINAFGNRRWISHWWEFNEN